MDEASATGPLLPVEGKETWDRHPADRARLATSLLILALGLAAVAWRPHTVRSVSSDLVQLLDRLPELLQVVLAGALQLVAVVAPIILVAQLVWGRRWRLLAVGAATAGLGALATSLLQGWLDQVVPPSVLAEAEADSWLTGRSFPSGAYLGATAAAATLLLPSVPRRWRRWLVGGVALAALCRMLTASVVPVNVVVILALGAAIGSVALIVLGAPTRRASIADATAGAVRAGAPIADVTPFDEKGGTRRFTATSDGQPVLVTLVGRDDRDAEVFSRAVRSLTTKAFDEQPLRLRGTTRLQHEALCTLAARRVVPAPDVLGVGETPEGDAVLVVTAPEGRPLDELPAGAVPLDAMWAAVARLQARRVAHGALTLAAFRERPDGVAVTGFRSGEVGADDEALAADLADLLVSSAAHVGVEAAVTAAVASPLPRAALATALPLVQPPALTIATRRGVDGLEDLCAEVRTALQGALDLEEVELLDLARITPAKIMSAAGTLFLSILVVAFVGNLDTIGEALREVDWAVLPVLVLLVVLNTFAGGWGLVSAVTTALPFLRTTEVMLAQGFLNRFTPANAGGMALRARYLQKNGVALADAATSVGLTSAASGAVQAVLLVGTYAWAGSSGSLGFSLPKASTLAAVVVVIGLVGGVLYATPWGRQVVFGRLGEVVGGAWQNLRTLATDPTKLFGLFGSALVSKVIIIVSFIASCRAADVTLATAQLTFLYMTANTVASAAPTPGGVGAIEAALIAALTGAGVEPTMAVSSVVVFRLATYWFPVPPSYVALRHLRAVDAV